MELKHSNLCFDERLFFKKDFSVDEFLTEHRRIANLETLRDDLGIFLKNLRSSTIELINKDYADFVDLSTNLIALESNIVGIEAPIVRVRDEILNSKSVLDERIERISGLLSSKLAICKKIQSIQSKMKIQQILKKLDELLADTSSRDDYAENLLKLQRSLNEVNQYYFHSKQCDEETVQIFEKDFDRLFAIFLSHLKDTFLETVRLQQDGLINCLRLYFAVNKVSLAHEVVRQEIVAPVFRKVISEESLKNDSSKLEGIYQKVLAFIDTDLRYLLDLTQLPSGKVHMRGYDFMVHSVWPELEKRLEMNLKSIYSPGNPDSFYKSFTATMSFLTKFEEHCITQASVNELRNSKSYKNFLNCWNLPVYYTLRFQDNGGKLEKIMHSQKFSVAKNNHEWKLIVTAEVWCCLKRCWAEGIFLRQLAHRFWKQSLQIIARYRVWAENIIQPSILSQLPTSKIEFLIYMYSDENTLIRKLPEIFELAHNRVGDHLSHEMIENMKKCLRESEGTLQITLKKVEDEMIRLVFEKTVSIIRQVSDIPRLYRRTNRDTPTQPCPYVASLFVLVRDLLEKHPTYAANWIPPILSSITVAYYEKVSEVLTSVQKTEESLRKFKQIRGPSTFNQKSNTDDDKIRKQLQIDVRCYIEAVKSLTSMPDIAKLEDLSKILESLQRN